MTGVQTCALPICFPVTIATSGFDVSTQRVERDEEMISELVKVAQDVQEYQVNMSLDARLYGIEE